MEEQIPSFPGTRLLRGEALSTTGQRRLLEEINRADDGHDNTSFSIMLAVLVGLILLFFVTCIYQVFKIWFLNMICSFRDHHGVVPNAPGGAADPVVLVHEGRAFNLTEHQRRAILETIFSSSSKAVTEHDSLCKKKVKKKKKFFNMDDDYDNEKELPMDAVEIPAALTDGTESVASQPVSNINNDAPLNSTMDTTIDSIQSSTKTSHVDEDDNQSQQSQLSEDICLETEMTLIENNIEKEISCSAWGENPENGPSTVMESNPKISILSRDEATTEENVHHCDGMVNEIIKDQDFSPHSVASRMRNQSFERSQSDDDDFVFSEVNVPDEDRKICSATDANKNVFRNDESVLDSSSARPTIEPVGSKDESVGEELGDLCSPVTLFSPLPLISRNSLATVTSEYTYDDDSTADDNLCPICLCGYQCGDILIESKHCTHIFHKECILEWLEKKDCCPVCRESMITDSELKSAATSLVGKTRMYRAVASMQPTPVRAPFAVRRPTSVRAPAGRGGPSLGGNIALSGTGQHTIRRTFS